MPRTTDKINLIEIELCKSSAGMDLLTLAGGMSCFDYENGYMSYTKACPDMFFRTIL